MSQDAITYQPLSADNIPAASDLATRVYDRFVAPYSVPAGNQELHRYLRPEAVQARLPANHFGLIALAAGRVVGLAEVRGFDHIALLFVAPEYQRRGLARGLLKRAVRLCQSNRPSLEAISVHAAPGASPSRQPS